MSIVLDNLPKEIEAELRLRAQERGTTPEEVAAAAILRHVVPRPELSATEPPSRKKRDLSYLSGRWVEDPAFDTAIANCRVVEPDMWK